MDKVNNQPCFFSRWICCFTLHYLIKACCEHSFTLNLKRVHFQNIV